jgi:hypothetical protein
MANHGSHRDPNAIRTRARGSDARRAVLFTIETFRGLARAGNADEKRMPDLLQMALCAREFSDVIIFRLPPLLVQRALLGSRPRSRNGAGTARRTLSLLGRHGA